MLKVDLDEIDRSLQGVRNANTSTYNADDRQRTPEGRFL
jgi:hypothetical protein